LLRRPYTRPGCGKRENRKRISTLAATTCPDPPDASALHRPKPQPARGDALGILLSFGLRCFIADTLSGSRAGRNLPFRDGFRALDSIRQRFEIQSSRAPRAVWRRNNSCCFANYV